MKQFKRQLSIVISLLLLLAMIPGTAFAISDAGLAASKASEIVDAIAAELDPATLEALETEQARVVALTSDPDDPVWDEVFALLPVDTLVADGKFGSEAAAEAAMMDLIADFSGIDFFGSADLYSEIYAVMDANISELYNTFGEANVNDVIDTLWSLDDSTYDYAGLADIIEAGTILLEASSTSDSLIAAAAQEVVDRVPASLITAAGPALSEAGWTAADVIEASFILAHKPAAAVSGGGGGGGLVTEEEEEPAPEVEVSSSDVDTTTETVDGQTVITATVEDSVIEAILDANTEGVVIVIPVSGSSDTVNAKLSGAIVDAMADGEAILEIQTPLGNYSLPAADIDIAAVAAELGAGSDLADITVTVTIAVPSADTVKIIEDAAEGSFAIVIPPIDFEITCTFGDKTVTVDRFESYVERMVPVPAGVDPAKITTAVVLDENGTMKHIPTKIVMIDGKYYAVFSSQTNSTYTVIYNEKSFDDVAEHWAKTDVNDMASRLVISGVGDNTFEPDRDITRAEFIAIVVRGLGLMRDGAGQESFADVTAADWYFDAVSIGKEYGISNGNGDGTFAPNSKITREEAMTMIARAARIAGIETTVTASVVSSELGKLSGSAAISDWARESAAICIQNSIIVGDNGSIDPQDNITRAETATIVKRVLKQAGLI